MTDAPQVRYVTSADGTRIATCALGSGPPLVVLNNFYLTIEIIWEIPEMVANLERLSRKRTIVLSDARGAGLSRQQVSDFSGDANVSDLAAVIDSLDSETVDILCPSTSSFVGITYAATYPDRMRKLVLHAPVVRGSDFFVAKERSLILPLAAENWPFYLQCLALFNYGWTDVGRRVAEKQAKEASRVVWAKSSDEWSKQDVSSLLPRVKCPTLILDPRRGSMVSRNVGASFEVAAAIADSRVARVTQDHILVLASSWDSCLQAVDEFLDEGDESRSPSVRRASVEAPSGTAIILFADIVDSTALTERMGDAAFREKARELDATLRAIIRERAGTPIEGKLLGDGVLAVFAGSAPAIEAALACGRAGGECGLPLHLGLHAGDVIREENNVYGGAVNIAARISGLSASGEVLVSRTVADLARTSAGVSFEDRGEHTLKGVSEPVRVYEVRWRT